jgi:hypothetical protein
MDDLRIPCVLWFPGDPPPDLSGFAEPICFPVRVVWRKAAASEQSVPIEPPPEPPSNDGSANTDSSGLLLGQVGSAVWGAIIPSANAQVAIVMPPPPPAAGGPINDPSLAAARYLTAGWQVVSQAISDAIGSIVSSQAGDTQAKPPADSAPIDKTPWSGDHQEIKGNIGAGPKDRVRISPAGDVWSQNPGGSWTNYGPASSHTGSGNPSGRRGKDRNQ